MEETLKQILNELKSMNGRMESVETTIRRIENGQETVKHQVVINAEDLTEIKAAVNSTNDRLDHHRIRLSKNEEEVHILKNRNQQ
jgi:chromosome segregation ATPase